MLGVEHCRVSPVLEGNLLGDMLTSLSTISRTLRQHALSASGLLPGQEAVLGLLQEEAGKRIGELAHELHVQQSSVSKTVRKLEEKCLCQSSFDTYDMRVVLVRLTPAGRQLQLLIKEAYTREESEILRYIPAEDRVVAINGLQMVCAALERRVSKVR